MAYPVVVRDHRHGDGARTVVFCGESPANGHLDAQDGEKTSGYGLAPRNPRDLATPHRREEGAPSHTRDRKLSAIQLDQILEGDLGELLTAIRMELSETYDSADRQAAS